MLHSITRGKLSASITTLGAELQSLKNTATGEEYIWQGDANYWQDRAPILFPIIGRLKEGQYRFNDQTYQLSKHGFARTADFCIEQHDPHALSLSLRANDQTKRCYPFDFVLLVTFSLTSDGLTVAYQVTNVGNTVMYFTLGSHPALRLPLDDGALSDYFIAFSQKETLDCYFLDNDLLCEKPTKAYLNNESIIPISESLFDQDALIFKNIQSHQIHLKHRHKGLRLTMDTGGAPHFGLWSKPNAPFICFEPWYSHDDPSATSGHLTEKPGMMTLKPGAMFDTHYQLSLSE